MFAPNIATFQVADQIHHERLTHSALLQKVVRERGADTTPYDRQVQRRITSRRLAATLAGALLAVSVAAMAAANQPSSGVSTGGGVTLIR